MADPAVALRYAQAYVWALETAGRLTPGLEELALLAETYQANKPLQQFLGSPEIAAEEKRGLITRLFSEMAGPEAMGLAQLLIRWDRADHLPLIAQAAQTLAEAKQGILRGVVTTAHPISSAEVSALCEALGKTLGKKVVLKRQLSPRLIGGMKVSVGSFLVDGSVRSLLSEVRAKLVGTEITSSSSRS